MSRCSARLASRRQRHERLIAQVKRLARVGTAREAVQVALEHYARSRDYSQVLALRGTGGVARGYDPKSSSPQRA